MTSPEFEKDKPRNRLSPKQIARAALVGVGVTLLPCIGWSFGLKYGVNKLFDAHEEVIDGYDRCALWVLLQDDFDPKSLTVTVAPDELTTQERTDCGITDEALRQGEIPTGFVVDDNTVVISSDMAAIRGDEAMERLEGMDVLEAWPWGAAGAAAGVVLDAALIIAYRRFGRQDDTEQWQAF